MCKVRAGLFEIAVQSARWMGTRIILYKNTYDTCEHAAPNKQMRAQRRKTPCGWGLQKALCKRPHVLTQQGREPDAVILAVASPAPLPAPNLSTSKQKTNLNSGIYLLPTQCTCFGKVPIGTFHLPSHFIV